MPITVDPAAAADPNPSSGDAVDRQPQPQAGETATAPAAPATPATSAGPRPALPAAQQALVAALRAGRGQFTLSFLQQLAIRAAQPDWVPTAKQVAAAQRCLVIEQHRQQHRQPRKLDLSTLPSGRYAAADDAGIIRFVRLDRLRRGQWAGWIFVTEPASGRKIGSQSPRRSYRGGLTDVLRNVARDPLHAAELFGRRLGVCGQCGHALTDPVSRARGIGPICARRLTPIRVRVRVRADAGVGVPARQVPPTPGRPTPAAGGGSRQGAFR